ncbi:MAG: ABC transporter permease [Lachnospiraceae bacterium]|nr:ABC transporter permease [Lachnospiraceae bacterium]
MSRDKGDFRLRKDISHQRYISSAIIAFVVIFVGWTLLCASGTVKELFLPSPTKVLNDIIAGAKDGSLWVNMGYSIFRVTMGFVISVVIGVPLGILAGSFRPFEAIIAPICEFVRYMPVPAFVPLVMVWCGIGEGAKITIVFLGCFFQLVLMIADDARSVSDDLLSSSYTLGTSRWSTITKVLIPAMAPKMMLTLRMLVGWGWTYLTVAELVASSSGLGYSILKAQRFLHTESIFSGILVIGVLGLITDRLFAFAIKKMFPWAE